MPVGAVDSNLPDPILALIEQHKATRAAFLAACEEHSSGRKHKGDADFEKNVVDRLCGEANGRLKALLVTAPTSFAGLDALIRHLLDCETTEEQVFYVDIEEFEERYPVANSAGLALLHSLVRSLDMIANRAKAS